MFLHIFGSRLSLQRCLWRKYPWKIEIGFLSKAMTYLSANQIIKIMSSSGTEFGQVSQETPCEAGVSSAQGFSLRTQVPCSASVWYHMCVHRSWRARDAEDSHAACCALSDQVHCLFPESHVFCQHPGNWQGLCKLERRLNLR